MKTKILISVIFIIFFGYNWRILSLEIKNASKIEKILDMSIELDKRIKLVHSLKNLTDEEADKLIIFLNVCDPQLCSPIISVLKGELRKQENPERKKRIEDIIIERAKKATDTTTDLINLANIVLSLEAQGIFWGPGKVELEDASAPFKTLSILLSDILKKIPPDKRFEFIKNEQFLNWAKTFLVAQQEPFLDVIFELLEKTNNPNEKLVLIKILNDQQMGLIPDSKLPVLVKIMGNTGDKTLATEVEKLLQNITGIKPGNVSWNSWLEKYNNNNASIESLGNKSLPNQERFNSVRRLSRSFWREHGDKSPFFRDDKIRNAITKVIYDKNDNVDVKRFLMNEVMFSADFQIKNNKGLDPAIERFVKQLISDFMYDPNYYEAIFKPDCYSLFDDKEIRTKLQKLSTDNQAANVCRAGAIWKLAFLTRDVKEVKRLANMALLLLIEENKGKTCFDLKNPTVTYLIFIVLSFTHTDIGNVDIGKLNIDALKKSIDKIPDKLPEGLIEKLEKLGKIEKLTK